MFSESIFCLHSKCEEKHVLDNKVICIFPTNAENYFRIFNPSLSFFFFFLEMKALLTKSPYVHSLPKHEALVFS